MKKVIYECVGNSILFALMGLLLIHPFSEYSTSADGFSAVTGVFPLIFIVYLILFAGIRFFVFRDGKKSKYKNSELSFADEREKIIVAESTKTAYQVLVFALMVSMAILAGIRFFSLTLLENANISIYSIGIALITMNLILAMVSYCVKWCREYRK